MQHLLMCLIIQHHKIFSISEMLASKILKHITLSPDLLFTISSSNPLLLQNYPIEFVVVLVVKPLKETFKQLP